ncbi:MAG: sensor histidine kinase [bacterium]|jgi:two-component system phosphate regulon sensor histidine kinase PhoR
MLDTKNTSPGSIALILSLIVSLFSGILIFIISNNVYFNLGAILSIFLVCLFLSRFLIDKFIYRKIKLIYKFIHQTKASKREEFFKKSVLPQKNIEEVGEEVLQWADQRKAEMEMLEKNEAFRKEFLQNLAHEFKTPVFALQGYLETLIEGASENPEIRSKFLSNAHKNTERLINLISDLDEITRLESGKQEMHYSNFIIQDLINEVYESLIIKSDPKKIKCLIKKGCEQPISVHADKEKIRQVLINLTDNAIKYGNAEGHVEASVYRTDDDKVLVEISDDGIGIAEEHLPRIFERFYRTDYGRSRNVGGTGLGLAICKHIIEAHGEIIHVRSKPAVGTTFGFSLNAKK